MLHPVHAPNTRPSNVDIICPRHFELDHVIKLDSDMHVGMDTCSEKMFDSSDEENEFNLSDSIIDGENCDEYDSMVRLLDTNIEMC